MARFSYPCSYTSLEYAFVELCLLWLCYAIPVRAYGPLARYVILRVAQASGMPGTFSLPPRVSDPDMHHGTCVPHVPWCMPGSLFSSFLWSRSLGKRSRHSRCMRNPIVCIPKYAMVASVTLTSNWHGPKEILKKEVHSTANPEQYICLLGFNMHTDTFILKFNQIVLPIT